MNKTDVVIVQSVRTPIGVFLGPLKDVSTQKLGGLVIREVLTRAGLDQNEVDEVIFGNVSQHDTRGNPTREATLEAGLPIEIPSFTVNKNCASGAKSVCLAAALIKAGEAEVVVAGGMENMSRSPYLLRNARTGYRLGDGILVDALTDSLEGMGLTAERLAERHGISREEQDEFACDSQQKAAAAQRAGAFEAEIVPVSVPQRKKDPIVVRQDEGLRPNTTREILAALKPVFKEGGTVTAGNASTINDGAAAVLLMSAGKASQLGLTPIGGITGYATAGCDPQIMGIGPVPATRRLLERTGMSLADFDLVELNEAFAAQALAVIRELKLDRTRVNVNGGAIALGHPTGATGAILITKILHELQRRNAKHGLVTLCIGGGQGIAVAVERL